MFVGYPIGTKGYRVWIEDEQRCRTSRNVVFNEDELYKHTVKGENTETKKKKERIVMVKSVLNGGSHLAMS